MNKVLLFILITLCLFLNSCTKKKVYNEYTVKNLDKVLNDTLSFKSLERPLMFEVIIEGHIKGNAVIEFESSPEIKLSGRINDTLKAEWYSSKLTFRYTPISVVKGDSLILKYRMY